MPVLPLILTLVVLGAQVVSPFLAKFAFADETDTVEATVTAIVYSVSLDNSNGIAFGNVAQNSNKDTTTGGSGVDDTTTATNIGSVAEKLNIQSTDANNGEGWTLGADPGVETYGLNFCPGNCDSTPSWSSVGIASEYATLVSSLGIGLTQPFDLQIETPTSTTDTTEQSITVTVQATAP